MTDIIYVSLDKTSVAASAPASAQAGAALYSFRTISLQYQR